jgi:hypothetical protein
MITRPDDLLRGSFLVLDIDQQPDVSLFRKGSRYWQAQRDLIRDNIKKEIAIPN